MTYSQKANPNATNSELDAKVIIKRYATPYDIGIGDRVEYKGNSYDVLINYIKGETDRKGYTPNMNRTILIDSTDTKVTCLDYKQLEVTEQITDHGVLV